MRNDERTFIMSQLTVIKPCLDEAGTEDELQAFDNLCKFVNGEVIVEKGQ